jgi:outer membrane protein assembly factor BamB
LPVGKPRSSTPAAKVAAKPTPPSEAPKPKPRTRPTPIRPKQFVWAFPPEPPFSDEALPMKNAPAVDAAGQCILYHQGRLYALVEEQGRGRVVWDYVVGCQVPGRIVVAPDGTLRAHSADGLLHAVSTQGKQVFPPAQVGEPLGWAAPVVDAAGNTFISSYEGGLVRVDPNGKVAARRYFRTRRKFDSAGILVGNVLYIGSEDPYVFAIDVSGDRGVAVWSMAAEQGLVGGFVNSSPALTADGVIVVAVRDESVVALNPSGTIAWQTPMPGQLLGSPVIDRHGHVYIGVSQAQRGQDPRGMLVCIDGNSHRIRWQFDTPAPVESTPVIGDDDVLYFGDNSGTIHALDLQGKEQWTAQVESPIRSPGTLLAPNRLAFGLDDDTLVVVECSSRGLAREGWPKIGHTLGQSGVAR